MAVKKSAKKSAAKKAPAKKASVKKTVAKKAAVKKVAAKKVAKKAPVKKVVAKKAVAKKTTAKKASAKKVTRKAPVKKAATKKVTATKAPGRIIIDADSPMSFDSNRVEIISTTPQPRSIPALATQEQSDRQGSAQSQKSSSRVVLAVIVGVILIAVFVVARNHNTSATPKSPAPSTTPATPTGAPSPVDVATPTTAPTSPASISSAPATPGAAASSTDLPPIGIVAHYTSKGATIFWRADTNASGLTTYNIEKSSDGGVFKLIATVPATQLSLDVTESDTNGWTSFKVSAVYSDGSTIAGKVFGLPGQYS